MPKKHRSNKKLEMYRITPLGALGIEAYDKLRIVMLNNKVNGIVLSEGHLHFTELKWVKGDK